MKEKCDHLLGWKWQDFEVEGDHELEKSFVVESDKQELLDHNFDFCPLCGSPLRETPLDRVLWKAVNKPNPGGLFPSQSLEHAVEFLQLCKEKVGESYISVDKIDSSNGYYNNPMVYGWEVSIKATEFFSASLTKALTKALLWATTELTKETVESLIKEEEKT